MAYQFIQTKQGEFAVDWEVVARIIESCMRARLQLKSAEVVRESQKALLWATFLVGASKAGIGTAAGAAFFGAAAGTALKTTATYQDTGSEGLAVIEATTGIVFTVLPPLRGAALAGKEQVAKVIVTTAVDTAKGLVEGKSVSQSLLNGSLNLVAPVAGKLAESKPVRELLNRTAVPVVTRLMTGPPSTLNSLPGKVVKKTAEDLTKEGGKALISSLYQSKPTNGGADSEDPSINSLTFEDDLLIKFALVDMSKGIGHSSW